MNASVFDPIENLSQGSRESALASFAAKLEAVRLAVGKPSYARLEAAAGSLRTSTISTVLRGETNPTLDFVLGFIRACRLVARRAGYGVGDEMGDEQLWRVAWLDLQRQLGAQRRTRAVGGSSARPAGAQPSPSGQRPPRHLPPDVSVFTGRSEELTALDAVLEGSGSPATPIAVIDGMPGVGKTTLAVHWAHRVRKHFTDGDLFVDLRGFGPGRPMASEVALAALLRALGASAETSSTDLGELTARYRTLTADLRILVVLDNAVSTEQIRPLVPAGAAAMVVVTSRNSITGLTSHEGARRITTRPLSHEDSSRLLERIIGDRARQAPRDTAEVARLCGYLPIMLRVVADRANTRPHASMETLGTELLERRTRRADGAEDDLPSTTSTALSWSYAALPDESKSTFRLLGLHPTGELSLAAASALLDSAEHETRRQLEVLTATHLLDEVATYRYRLHDIMADYARNLGYRQDTSFRRSAALSRLVDWYLGAADAADRSLVPTRRHVPLDSWRRVPARPVFGDYDSALGWYDVECENLVAVTRLAAAIGRHDVAWKLPCAALGYFHLRKPWHRWIEAGETACDSARRMGDRLGLASSRYALGIAYRETGALARAKLCFDEALAVYRELGDLYGQAHVLNNVGMTACAQGLPREALDAYRKALRISRRLDDKRALRISLSSAAELEARFGHFDKALSYARAGVALSVEIADGDGEGRALCTMGYSYAGLGLFDAATDCYHQATAVMSRVGDRHGVALALDRQAQLFHQAHRLEDARDAMMRAAEILDSLHDPQVAEVRERLDELDRETAARYCLQPRSPSDSD